MKTYHFGLIALTSFLVAGCAVTNTKYPIFFEANYGYDGEIIESIFEPVELKPKPIKSIARIEAKREIDVAKDESKLTNIITKYSAKFVDNNYVVKGNIDNDMPIDFICNFKNRGESVDKCTTKSDEKAFQAEILDKILTQAFQSEYNALFMNEHAVYSGKKGFINSHPVKDAVITMFESMAPEVNPNVSTSDSYFEVLGMSSYKGRKVVVVGSKGSFRISMPQFAIEVITEGFHSFDLETANMLSGKNVSYLKTNGVLTNKEISRYSLIDIDV